MLQPSHRHCLDRCLEGATAVLTAGRNIRGGVCNSCDQTLALCNDALTRIHDHVGDGGCCRGGRGRDCCAVDRAGGLSVAGPVVKRAVGHCDDVLREVEGGGDDDHGEGEEDERVCSSELVPWKDDRKREGVLY